MDDGRTFGRVGSVKCKNGPTIVQVVRCELKKERRNAPQWPTFPPPQNGSIIGAVLFHCQVRDGTGWDQYAQITEQIFSA